MSQSSAHPSPIRSPASRAASQREPVGRAAWLGRIALNPSSPREIADAKRQHPQILWDGNGRVYYTTLSHPDLLVYIYQFGLGVPNPRTLLEFVEAERFLHRNVQLLNEQHTAWHYVQALRADPWNFEVPDRLIEQRFELYLRTLLWHLQDSQQPAPPPYDGDGDREGETEGEGSNAV